MINRWSAAENDRQKNYRQFAQIPVTIAGRFGRIEKNRFRREGVGKGLPTAMKREIIKGLDLCKCISALLILLYHFGVERLTAGFSSPSFAAAPQFARWIEIACDLFFLTSGFSLWLGWGEGGNPSAYAKKRALAIYPMFWTGFFALFFYGEILHGNNREIPGWRLLFSILGLDGYLSQWTPTFYKIGEWFLGCLILLYGVFSLLAWLMRRSWGRRLLTAVCVCLWAFWPLACPVGWNARHTVLGSLPVFCAGMALARGWNNKTVQTWGWLGADLSIWALALLLWKGSVAPWLGPVTSVLLFCGLLWLGQRLPAGVGTGLHWLAGESYGIFLTHHVFLTLVWLRVMARFAIGPVVGFALYAPLCCVLAVLLRTVAWPVHEGFAWLLRRI
mgnify:FL=1